MLKIFKGLATVTIWIMFIFAWGFSVLTLIFGGINGELSGTDPPSMQFMILLALSIGFAFAGGFLLLVRKKLE